MSNPMPRQRNAAENTVGITMTALGLFLYLCTLLGGAWLCDDAHISYRVVDNFLNGYGLTWNVIERVQPYTHPLWLFLNIAAYAITGEAFLTFHAVGIVVSFCVMLLLVAKLARSWGAAAMAVFVLLFSRAFMDYSTSGLENPLTHLLLALFLIVYFRFQWTPRTVLALAFIAALAALNRMDSILLFLPPLGWAWLTLRTRRATGALVLGFLPFIAWELFSLVYYGFPFPNTAYAKLGTGLSSEELWMQGINYFLHSYHRDPGTLVFMFLGLAAGCFFKDKRYAMLSLGGTLYLLYVVRIGGDFMGGRFFSAVLFLAVILLARLEMPALSPRTWAIGIIAAVLSLSRPFSPPITGPEIGDREQAFVREDGVRIEKFQDPTGVGDERRFWYSDGGLLAAAPPAPVWMAALPYPLNVPLTSLTRGLLVYQTGPRKPMPSHKYAEDGRTYRQTGEKGPKLHGSIGFRGFLAGPTTYIVDYYALSDPLLARIPAKFNPKWRIGHFYRERPAGYMESVFDENKLKDENLAAYYEHLKRITRGPLFTADRWKTIINMNLGRYDHLVDWDGIRFAGMRTMSLEQLGNIKKSGSAWNAPGNILLTDKQGLQIDIGRVVHNSGVEFSLDNKDRYLFLYVRNKEVIGQTDFTAPPGSGLVTVTVPTPLAGVRDGFDTIRVFVHPEQRRLETKFSLGHARLR